LRAVDPVEALAGVAMTRGELAEAERRWHRQLVDSATAALRPDQLLPGDRRYDELARFYAAAGDLPRARAMLASAMAEDSVLGRDLKAERSWTRGVLALAEGRAAEAVPELRRAAELYVCAICPLPDLGRALEAAGKTREALQAYDHYLSTPWMWRYEPDAVELGWTLRRAGELHEDLGERDKAREAYTRLLALWEHADPPLQAVTADVRSRRAALSEEPSASNAYGADTDSSSFR
jgi:tetratricopeptide (TPR) repeat protein